MRRDQNGRYLLVVGANDVVEQRPVEVGPAIGGCARSPVSASDQVVIDGISARAGSEVAPGGRRDAALSGTDGRSLPATPSGIPEARHARRLPAREATAMREAQRASGMISSFFIDRPIFANVIAIVTMLFGVVALLRLPVEQYPEITPPTVQVTTQLSRRQRRGRANTVAAPIEQQVNGVENMLYMSSTSRSDGSYALTVTFEIGTDLDKAQVLVQNRVAIAEPLLPEEVRRQGVTVKKQSTNIILVVSLTSPDDTYDSLFLRNYATLRLRDELSRCRASATCTVFGAGEYSMRVWLDPSKLKARGLTTQDVVAAIQEQNVQVAAGQVGQPPAPDGQEFQYTVDDARAG